MVRFANQYYQLQPLHKAAVGKGMVRVQPYLNGELHFRYGERELQYTLLPERPQPAVNQKLRKRWVYLREKYVPPTSHVWRSFQFGKGSPRPLNHTEQRNELRGLF